MILAIQGATSRELASEHFVPGGPGDAILVCHLSATSLIYRLGREEGIAAGRTAARLRTQANAPRPWAAPIVKQYANAKAASVDGFVVDPGDKVGVCDLSFTVPSVQRATVSRKNWTRVFEGTLKRDTPRTARSDSKTATFADGSGSKCRRIGRQVRVGETRLVVA